MAPGLLIKVNDFGFTITFTILQASSTRNKPLAFDLTGLYVTFYVYTQEQDPTLLFYGVCNVSSPLTGMAIYTVQQGNFPKIGTYNAVLVMTDSIPPNIPSVVEVTTETFTIDVIPTHP